MLKGQVQITKTLNGKKVWESPWWDNLVVSNQDHGKNLIIQRLAGENQFSLNITHGDIGTDDTDPNLGQTQLLDAKSRAIASMISHTINQITFRLFYPSEVLPNDTYHEFGLFVDGEATENTGQLFNRIKFSTPYEKSTGEDTTITVRLTAL